MYNTIIVPLDGSRRAEEVLPYIQELAQRFESRVILIQVVEPHIEFSGGQAARQDEALENFKRQAKQAEAYLNLIKSQLEDKGLHVQIEVAYGEAIKPIIDIAKGMGVDLIAMTSHGRSGLSQVFYGSVTAGILQQVDRPLLLVRAKGDDQVADEEAYMYTTILVPLDGSKRAEKILPYVERLASGFESKVIFLQVVEPQYVYASPHTYYTDADLLAADREKVIGEAEAYLAGLQGEFRQRGIETRIVVTEGPVVRTIIQTAERVGADLIAMASHGRTGLARVFYGSIAAGVLHQVDRPLLIIRSEGDE